MDYFGPAIGITGALLTINFLLTLLLIRRVNAHGVRLARRGPGRAQMFALPSGGAVPSLTVPTVTGKPYSLGANADRTLVAFMTPGCTACERQLPELREYASTIPGGTAGVLAVVVAPDPDRAVRFANELTAWASVTIEPPQGTTQQVFAVSSYPSYYTVGAGGRIEAGSMTVRHLVAAARPT